MHAVEAALSNVEKGNYRSQLVKIVQQRLRCFFYIVYSLLFRSGLIPPRFLDLTEETLYTVHCTLYSVERFTLLTVQIKVISLPLPCPYQIGWITYHQFIIYYLIYFISFLMLLVKYAHNVFAKTVHLGKETMLLFCSIKNFFILYKER